MVGGRPLVASAVRAELRFNLAFELLNGEGQPGIGLYRARQIGGDEQQAGNIRKVVIAAPRLRPFQVADDVASVLEQLSHLPKKERQ